MQRLILCLALLSLDVFANPVWTASAGGGIAASPTLVLISPEIEYMATPRFFVGGLVQMGFSDSHFLTTISLSVRRFIGNHIYFKPFFSGGLGVGFGSGFAKSAGPHIHGGLGVDYWVSPYMSVGTHFRLNSVLSVKDIFTSWVVFSARFRF